MKADKRSPGRRPLEVINIESARFECTFGRGCEGVCCQQGRPPVDQRQQAVIDGLKSRWLPLLRPEARSVIEKDGWLSRRVKAGDKMVRVAGGGAFSFIRDACYMPLVPRTATPWATNRKPARFSRLKRMTTTNGSSASMVTRGRNGRNSFAWREKGNPARVQVVGRRDGTGFKVGRSGRW